MAGAKSGKSRVAEGRGAGGRELAAGEAEVVGTSVASGSCKPKATKSTSPEAVRGISHRNTGRTNIIGRVGLAGGKEGEQAREAVITRQPRMHKLTASRIESPKETSKGKLSI